jgi:hypothetical protein
LAWGQRAGVRGTQLPKYFFQHSIGLLQRYIIPKPDYPKALRLKKSSSFGVACDLLCMLPTIKLHNQLLIETDEINDAGWNRVLAPKFESTEIAVFQLQPQPQLSVGW